MQFPLRRSMFYGWLSGLLVFLIATLLPIWTAGYTLDKTERDWHEWSTSFWIVIWNTLAYPRQFSPKSSLRAAIDLEDMPQLAFVLVLAVLVGIAVWSSLRHREKRRATHNGT